MTEKIILALILVIGAVFNYLAEPIGRVIKISKVPEKNIVIIKIIGFIIVFLTLIITFVKF